MIECCRHFGEKSRVPVCIARDEQANFDPGGLHCKRRQANPALETGAGWIAENREEMIESEQCVVAGLVDCLPHRNQILPAAVLLGRLNSETDGTGHGAVPPYVDQPAESSYLYSLAELIGKRHEDQTFDFALSSFLMQQ